MRWLFAVATILAPALCWADDASVVVLGDSVHKRPIEGAAEVALGAEGLTVVASGLNVDAALEDCLEDPDCRPEFPAGTADFVLVVSLPARDQGAISLRMYRADGELAGSERRFVQDRSVEGMSRTVADGARAVARSGVQTSGDKAVLVIKTVPPGAVVRIDGEEIGATDIEYAVPAGRHSVDIDKQGFAPAARDVTVSVGERKQILLALEPAAAGSVARPEPVAADPGFAWKWAALGTGAALVTTGIVLIAIDRDSFDGQTRQKYSRDSAGAGALTAGLGGALLITGAALWFLEDDEPPVTVSFSPRQSTVAFSTRF